MTDGGVTRKIKKLYANVGGVNREIKQLWAKKDGVNRKIFNSGIRARIEIGYSQEGGTCSWNSGGGGSLMLPPIDDAMASIRYIFDEPIKPGQATSIQISYTLNHAIEESSFTASYKSDTFEDIIEQKKNLFEVGSHIFTLELGITARSFNSISFHIGYPNLTNYGATLSWAPSAIKITAGSETLPINDVYM